MKPDKMEAVETNIQNIPVNRHRTTLVANIFQYSTHFRGGRQRQCGLFFYSFALVSMFYSGVAVYFWLSRPSILSYIYFTLTYELISATRLVFHCYVPGKSIITHYTKTISTLGRIRTSMSM